VVTPQAGTTSTDPLVLTPSSVRALRTVSAGSLTRAAYSALLDAAEAGFARPRPPFRLLAHTLLGALLGGLCALAAVTFFPIPSLPSIAVVLATTLLGLAAGFTASLDLSRPQSW